MAADALVLYGARASAAIVLIQFSWNIPVSVPEGLNMSVVKWFVNSRFISDIVTAYSSLVQNQIW